MAIFNTIISPGSSENFELHGIDVSKIGQLDEIPGAYYSSATKDKVFLICQAKKDLWTSTDYGETFSRVTHNELSETIYKIECRKEGTIIMTSYYGYVWRSIDGGVTFSEQKLSDHYLNKIIYLKDDIWILLQADSLTGYRSIDDGVTWNEITIPQIASYTYGYTTDGDQTIIVPSGAADKLAIRSTDGGLTWETFDFPNRASDNLIRAIGYHDGTFLAMSYAANARWRSTDGIEWELITANDIGANQNILSGIYNGDVFLAFSRMHQYLFYSLDDGENFIKTANIFTSLNEVWKASIIANRCIVPASLSSAYPNIERIANTYIKT